jgi:DNA-binding CsgD family transcriptional regulator
MLSLESSGRMLTALGTQSFGQSLMAAAKELFDADFCSLFAFEAGRDPICLTSNGVRSDRLAAYAAEKYTGLHWRSDPIVNDRGHCRDRDVQVVAGLSQNQSSGAYRHDCIELLKIGDRVTLVFEEAAWFLRLSFYRYAANRPFSEQELGIIRESADFFHRATSRHYSLISRAGMDNKGTGLSRDAMKMRLLSLNRDLSQREVEVCSLTLQGVSTEGIGLEIGIRKTSVITYRKRAYAKLGISAQSQLFAACMSLAS